MYPTIVINNNLSFDTLYCTCCKNDSTAQVNQETIDIINQSLKENKITGCKKRSRTNRKE